MGQFRVSMVCPMRQDDKTGYFYTLPDDAWDSATLKHSCSITLQQPLGHDRYHWPAVLARCLGGGSSKPLILIQTLLDLLG